MEKTPEIRMKRMRMMRKFLRRPFMSIKTF